MRAAQKRVQGVQKEETTEASGEAIKERGQRFVDPVGKAGNAEGVAR